VKAAATIPARPPADAREFFYFEISFSLSALGVLPGAVRLASNLNIGAVDQL
jgi:hypothetical protein